MSEDKAHIDITPMLRNLRVPRVDQSPAQYAEAINPPMRHHVEQATSELKWVVVGFVCALATAVLVYLEAASRLFP